MVVKESCIQFTNTQRGRIMLNYGGYKYVQNRQSTKNIFWRCARYVKHGCRASCVTAKHSTSEHLIRRSGTAHSHPSECADSKVS